MSTATLTGSSLDELIAAASPEGGWGYVPGQVPQLEPTSLALLACATEPERTAPVAAKAREFLARGKKLGAFPQTPGRAEALWPTALVLFAELASGTPAEALADTAGFLLEYRGKPAPTKNECDETNAVDPNHDIDVTLIGWPWAEQNFSWVEPTAWACLALRRFGLGDHPRVRDGKRLLLDRALDTGGANYGNRRILDKILEPIPGPSALMLLALQGETHPRIDAAVGYLLREIEHADVEHLAWAKLALELHRDRPEVAAALPEIDAKLADAVDARRSTPWVQPSTVRLALVALAQAADTHSVFRLPQTKPVAVPSAPQAPALSLGQRFKKWLRGVALQGASNLRNFPVHSNVHVARAESYDADLLAVLQKQYDLFRATVPLAGKRVVLKPNLVEWHRDKVINTNPKVIGAAIALCKAEGAAEVIVAEGPGHWRNVEYLVAASGLGEVLAEHDVRFVDLNHDVPKKMPNLGQLTGLESIYLAKTIAEADVVISMPKLKTHHWAVATLSLKNLFGTVPGICYGWPKNELHWRGIPNSIVDIALTRTPELAIVDGIVGMEGDGPLKGDAKPMGVLVMGHDLVAVDATCARLMMLDPERIDYLVLGHAKRLGRLKEGEITQIGEPIAALAKPFAQVAHFASLTRRA